MVGLDQQSAPKQLFNEVPSHVVLVTNKVGAVLCYRNMTKTVFGGPKMFIPVGHGGTLIQIVIKLMALSMKIPPPNTMY